ncbi:hypothetical protein ACROYT_G003273 [Oculina patagonica]
MVQARSVAPLRQAKPAVCTEEHAFWKATQMVLRTWGADVLLDLKEGVVKRHCFGEQAFLVDDQTGMLKHVHRRNDYKIIKML